MFSMKKLVLRSCSVGAVLFAMSGVASAQDSELQIVDADINSALQLDIDAAFAPALWLLDSGTTNLNNSLVLRAYANVQYGIQQNCDADATKSAAGAENNLFEFDTASSTYAVTTNHPDGGAGMFINADLFIHEFGGPAAVAIDTAPATLPGVTAEPTTPVGGQTHTVEVSQLVDFGDKSLTETLGASVYHMETTFTILPGI
jgi:hypothetical protein